MSGYAVDHAERVIYVDRALWQTLAEARSEEDFSRSWLALQCSFIAGASGGVVVLGEPDTGPFRPVAMWPEGKTASTGLAKAAEQTLAEGQAQLLAPDSDDPLRLSRVAYPITVDVNIYGVVAVEVAEATAANLQTILQQLQWGAAWLEVFLRRRDYRQTSNVNESMMIVLDLIAVALERDRFKEAALAFVTELASRLDCDRVSIGFIRRRQARVAAMSHSAQMGGQMELVRSIGAAMDEAIDQQAAVSLPLLPALGTVVTREHEKLAREHAMGSVVTIPMFHDGEACGALMLERPADRPFDDVTLDLVRALAAITGPMFETRRRDDRPLVMKAGSSFMMQAGRLLGSGYLGRKLVAVLIVLAVVATSLISGEHRVTADSRLEGAVRRIVSAPIDGFIVQAYARAGDIVDEGAVLVELDDRDLRLEQLREQSARAQLIGQLQDARAKYERAQLQVINAQIAQSDAQLALIAEQLERTSIKAPFGGIIVSGDLSQSLGAAVARGDVMFELAPLEGYRVILRVDEHDIGNLAVGQSGTLLLSSLPDEPLPLTVNKITPVAMAEEGINYFRVEAGLDSLTPRLRPGMEGVAKVDIGQRSLIWIWTHRAVEWVRLWWWRWWP